MVGKCLSARVRKWRQFPFVRVGRSPITGFDHSIGIIFLQMAVKSATPRKRGPIGGLVTVPDEGPLMTASRRSSVSGNPDSRVNDSEQNIEDLTGAESQMLQEGIVQGLPSTAGGLIRRLGQELTCPIWYVSCESLWSD
jgi:hypothetical protein